MKTTRTNAGTPRSRKPAPKPRTPARREAAEPARLEKDVAALKQSVLASHTVAAWVGQVVGVLEGIAATGRAILRQTRVEGSPFHGAGYADELALAVGSLEDIATHFANATPRARLYLIDPVDLLVPPGERDD